MHYGVKGMKWKNHVYVDAYYNAGLGRSVTNKVSGRAKTNTAASRTGVIGVQGKGKSGNKIKTGNAQTEDDSLTKKKDRGAKEWESHDWVKNAREKADSGASKLSTKSMQSREIKNYADNGRNIIQEMVSHAPSQTKKKK
jgi:hypothetical protein